jgi:soluble lytic murein transglycosylase-like protein
VKQEELIQMARTRAEQFSIPPALVCAVIEQESKWDPWAVRYEKAFQEKYISPLIARGVLKTFGASGHTEAVLRSCSFGLMQVMGQVAREHGFLGAFLSEVCDPERAVELGCSHLAGKLEKANGNAAQALQLWNGGTNPRYAAEVLARMGSYS